MEDKAAQDTPPKVKLPWGVRFISLPGMGFAWIILVGSLLFWFIGSVSDRTVEKYLFRFEPSPTGYTAHLLKKSDDAEASIVNPEPKYAEVTVWRDRIGLGARSRYTRNRVVFIPRSIRATLRYQIWDDRGASMVPKPDYSRTGLDPETLKMLRSLLGGIPPEQQQNLYDAIAAYFNSIGEPRVAAATRTHATSFRELRPLGWMAILITIGLFFAIPTAWGRIKILRNAKLKGLTFPKSSSRSD